MKLLVRVLLLAVLVFCGSLFVHLDPNIDKQGLDQQQGKVANDSIKKKNQPKKQTLKRPQYGISQLIGQSTDTLIEQFGQPKRIDETAYDYKWWIYNQNDLEYMQVGIENDKVVTVYAVGDSLNLEPFHIGDSLTSLAKKVPLDSTVEVNDKSNVYRFELNEDDLNVRPLIKLGNIYAQLGIDKFTNRLSSVRFLDKETLIKQRPYEIVYQGDLLNAAPIDEDKWKEIERGSEQQIFDLSNIIRKRFEVANLKWDEGTALSSYEHSKDMENNKYFSHTSPKYGDLAKRLKKDQIAYQLAGENIAANYVDGPAAVEGWLNSAGHRKSLLEEDFTNIGVGVYKKYYTQEFIEKPW